MLQLDSSSPPTFAGEELAERMEMQGYLVLSSPDALGERLDALWRAGDAFFPQTSAIKLRNRADNEDGYHGVSRERPDLGESFWVGLDRGHDSWRFPDAVGRTLHRAALDVAVDLEVLLRPVTHILAQHYTGPAFQPEHAFTCDRASRLQLCHYPPYAQRREILTDYHKNGHYLTLVFADGLGLEVLTPAGRRLQVTPKAGELIAMPGKTFSLLSGFSVSPLPYRLRNQPQVGWRYAMIFFADPNPDDLHLWRHEATNDGVDILAWRSKPQPRPPADCATDPSSSSGELRQFPYELLRGL